MKTQIFSAVFICLSFLSYGQLNMDIGLRGGVNYVNNIYQLDDPDPNGSKYRLGYHIGILTKVKLTGRFFLSPELSFNNKGYHVEASTGSVPAGSSNVHLNYVSLPALLEFRPIEKIGLLLGPELSYLVSAKNRFDTQTIDLIDFWDNANLDYNRLDLGLAIGSNVNLTKKLKLGIRYTHGLSSLFQVDGAFTDVHGNIIEGAENPKNSNRTLQFGATYIIK